MKKISSDETEFLGKWILQDGKPLADAVCARIDFLINHCLDFKGRDTSGWDVLYQDPADGRYWELTYPDAYLHGGGAPALRVCSVEDAREKYPMCAI